MTLSHFVWVLYIPLCIVYPHNVPIGYSGRLRKTNHPPAPAPTLPGMTDQNLTTATLMDMGLSSLKQICRDKGVIGYSKKTKVEIVSMLATNPPCADLAVFNSEAEIAMRANGWKRARVRADVARLNRALMLARLNDRLIPARLNDTPETVMRSDLPPKSSVFKSFDTYRLLDVVQSGEVIKEVDMLELSRLLMAVHKSAA